MYDIRKINEIVGGIGGNKIRATKIGKKKVLFWQIDGEIVERVLYPVKYCANAQQPLLLLTNEMSNQGAKILSDD